MENKENVQIKRKGPKMITLIIIGIILTLLVGTQVFASMNGYGNIFFLIRNLVTTGTLSGEDEIFYDKEITLSYQSIDIADGVKMQVNKLEIREKNSTFCLNITASDNNNVLPLKYSIKSEGLKETDVDSINKDKTSGKFEERLTVNYKFSDDELITLYVKDNKGTLLKEIEINLYTQEIFITGESEVSKISQIELKKYLNVFSELKNNFGNEEDRLVSIAGEILLKVQDSYSEQSIKREVINEVVKEFYGEKAKFLTQKDKEGNEIEVLSTNKVLLKDGKYNFNTTFSDYKNGICLKIDDINYENGIYTVKYIYTLANEEEIDKNNVEELPQYEVTIKLKRNESAKYSKYEVVEIGEETLVSEKIGVDIKEEPTEYNDEHIHNYVAIENTGTKGEDGTHTTLDGTHIERCTICGKETRQIHNFGEWFDIGGAWTLWCNDCKDYVYTTDYNVVKNSGYRIHEDTTHTHDYKVVQNSGTKAEDGGMHTTLDGTHKAVCSICGDEKREPHNFGKWFDIGYGWTLWCDDCKDYVFTQDYSVVQNSGYGMHEETTHTHTHDYQVIQNSGTKAEDGGMHTTLDGTHKAVCSECGDEIEEPHNFGKWFDIGYGWTLWCNDCKDYVFTQDYSVVENSGYGMNE